MQTGDAALDLSSLTSLSTLISSTNAAGTTFTVSSAAVGLNILGGTGQDAVVGQGFSFNNDQRSEIFFTRSVESITDQSGSYAGAAGATLTARAGGDLLAGGAGVDKLIGGFGADTLTGGGGDDAFVFNFAAFGKDTITDFKPGADILQFDHAIFADAASVLSHAAQVGSDTVITYDAQDTITIHNVQLANLHQSDFHIV